MYYRVTFEVTEYELTEESRAKELEAMQNEEIQEYEVETEKHVYPMDKIFQGKNPTDVRAQAEQFATKQAIKWEEEYEIKEIQPISADELVQNELKKLHEKLFYIYIVNHLKPRGDKKKKYQELKEKYLNEPEYFYELIRYTNRQIDAECYVGRYRDRKYLKGLSAKDFFDSVDRAMLEQQDD